MIASEALLTLRPPPSLPSPLTHFSADILKPSPVGHHRSDRRMSIDFSSTPTPQGMYPPPDLDQPFGSLQANDLNSAHQHSSHHLSMNGHGNDALDMSEHGSYDIFSSAASGSLASQRYRTNASSSSSLGHNYALGVDPMYSQSSFSDPLPPFPPPPNGHYDLMNGLPSSYSSGKPSPLTPNDNVPGLPHPSSFPFSNGHTKEYSHSSFQDPLLDHRRLSNVSSSFSDYGDEYGSMGVNPNLALGGFQPPQSVQPFQDRLGRISSDGRYPGAGPLAVPPHMHQSHNSDLMRGVAPQATHSFRQDGVPFDDMPQYMAPHSQVDFTLRIPSVDENLARLRLQGAGDLQSFIRYVSNDLYCSMLLYLTYCASRFNLQSLFGSICTNAESLGIRRTHCHRYVFQSGSKILWNGEAVSRLDRAHVRLLGGDSDRIL